MKNKLVSVIIPTYNRADRVIEAVRSAQQQSYPAKQIIVIDDGSNDETARRVAEFEGVEYYYQPHSRQGAARTHGLKKAHGEYIATLDSDDVWNEDFLAESVRCLEKNRLDFVFSSWWTISPWGEFESAWVRSGVWKKYAKANSDDWFLLNSKQVRRLFIETCPAPSSSILVKRESLVSEWSSDLIIADDWCVMLDMILSKPCRAAFTLKQLWTKYVHNDNIYDGRCRKDVIPELDLHDMKFLKERYSSQLTLGEKSFFNMRIAKGYFLLGAYFFRSALFDRKGKHNGNGHENGNGNGNGNGNSNGKLNRIALDEINENS